MALISCPDCNKEVSSRAPACPNCGAPIAPPKEAPKKGDYLPYSDQEVAVMLSKKRKTNHVLHLLLSVVTVGFWVVIWFMAAVQNSVDAGKIDRQIARGKKMR